MLILSNNLSVSQKNFTLCSNQNPRESYTLRWFIWLLNLLSFIGFCFLLYLSFLCSLFVEGNKSFIMLFPYLSIIYCAPLPLYFLVLVLKFNYRSESHFIFGQEAFGDGISFCHQEIHNVIGFSLDKVYGILSTYKQVSVLAN